MNDPVWDAYRDIMSKSVIELSEDGKKDLPRDLEYRIKHSLPPGYRDADKSDGGSGDLIIWKTILEASAARKADMVFVTMDQKNDWWSQAGGSALFPRFELIEEFRSFTGGNTLHILKFSEFLDLFGAEISAVEEVQRAEAISESQGEIIDEIDASHGSFSPNLARQIGMIKYLKNKLDYIEKTIENKKYPLNRYIGRSDEFRIERELSTISRLEMERDTISSEINRLNALMSPNRSSIVHLYSDKQSDTD